MKQFLEALRNLAGSHFEPGGMKQVLEALRIPGALLEAILTLVVGNGSWQTSGVLLYAILNLLV